MKTKATVAAIAASQEVKRQHLHPANTQDIDPNIEIISGHLVRPDGSINVTKPTLKAGHTPGPWELEYDGSLVMAHHVLTNGPSLGPDGSSKEERLANHRLIAAAPETAMERDELRKLNISNVAKASQFVLERDAARKEAKKLLEALKGLFEHCSMIHNQWGEGSNQIQASAAIKKAKEAIAIATEGQTK